MLRDRLIEQNEVAPILKRIDTSIVAIFAALVAQTAALVPGVPLVPAASRPAVSVRMGPAEDGPFTPICLAGKVVLGQTQFNKIRGKVISYHSG